MSSRFWFHREPLHVRLFRMMMVPNRKSSKRPDIEKPSEEKKVWMSPREFKKYVDSIPASTRPASVPPKERRVQIAAARARITIDRRLGVKTPEWIIALAKENGEPIPSRLKLHNY